MHVSAAATVVAPSWQAFTLLHAPSAKVPKKQRSNLIVKQIIIHTTYVRPLCKGIRHVLHMIRRGVLCKSRISSRDIVQGQVEGLIRGREELVAPNRSAVGCSVV